MAASTQFSAKIKLKQMIGNPLRNPEGRLGINEPPFQWQGLVAPVPMACQFTHYFKYGIFTRGVNRLSVKKRAVRGNNLRILKFFGSLRIDNFSL